MSTTATKDFHRNDLTDEEWQMIEALFAERNAVGRPYKDLRNTINGIIFRTREGCSWRSIPPCYGRGRSIWETKKRLEKDGMWDLIVLTLEAEAESKGILNTDDAKVDGTNVRAHVAAAGARRDSKKDIPTSRTITDSGGRVADGAAKSILL